MIGESLISTFCVINLYIAKEFRNMKIQIYILQFCHLIEVAYCHKIFFLIMSHIKEKTLNIVTPIKQTLIYCYNIQLHQKGREVKKV